MKKCSRCKSLKPLSEYNFKNLSKGLRQYHCKDCSRAYVQSHYYSHKKYYLQKAKKRNALVREQIRLYIYDFFKTHSCFDCGENDPIVLEFDHIRDKSFNISSAARDKTLEDVRQEIEKCEVRCANCHRRKTAIQFGWHKKYMPL